MRFFSLLCLSLLAALNMSVANVRLPKIFGDGMVLQRGQSIAVWGWADPGETITISLKDQKTTATAGNDGKWHTKLKSEKAGGPYQLTVAGKNTLTFSDVLIGDVWICSGQSNMEWPLTHTDNAEQEIANANSPMIRHVKIPNTVAGSPLSDVEANVSWKAANPTNAGSFTAVGYFFARELQQELGVPIGLINTSWGGTMVETWTSKEAFENDPEFADMITNAPTLDMEAIKGNPNAYPTLLFNAMVNPLIPYTIKGAIWYQGESNAGRAFQYRKAFPLMINDWRQRWGQGNFPFYFVQLASFKAAGGTSATGSTWAELREAQTLTLSLPHTGMAVTTDIGNTDDIHPRNKQDVGKRLALAALHDAYGKKIVYSGPTYKSFKVKGNQATVSFNHSKSGLIAKGSGSEVLGFEVAGEDQQFKPAKATINGSRVILQSEGVDHPVAVRYAWADDPGTSNLFNREGLPTDPFRSDNWTGVTEQAKYKP